MEWLTDEKIYYGGIIIAAAAVVVFLVNLCISMAASGRLKMKMKDEYGDLDREKKLH